MKALLNIEISEELQALATGYARFHGQSFEAYVMDALLSQVQADGEACLHRDVPESQAAAAARRRRS